MAESLSSAAEHGRNTPDVTQAVSLGFHDEMDAIDSEARGLREARKKLRLRVKQAGIELRGFDRARIDRERSAAEREAEDREYRRQMAWFMKPVGFQPSLDIDEAVEEGLRALNVHELHRIDTEGFEAGQSGRRRDSNPWNTGSEAAQRWDHAWIRGQSTIAATLSGGGDPGGNGVQKRGRGRPRKSETVESNA
jgi:ribosome modulation factor